MKPAESQRRCEGCGRIPTRVGSIDPFLCPSCHGTMRRRQGYRSPARQCVDCGEQRPLGGKGRCKPCYDRMLRRQRAELDGRPYRPAGVPRGSKVTAVVGAPAKPMEGHPAWEESVRRRYEQSGCTVHKLQKRGWPDFLVIDWAKYEVFFVEAKGRTDTLKHHQAIAHERLQQSGLRVVTEWQPATASLDGRLRRTKSI